MDKEALRPMKNWKRMLALNLALLFLIALLPTAALAANITLDTPVSYTKEAGTDHEVMTFTAEETGIYRLIITSKDHPDYNIYYDNPSAAYMNLHNKGDGKCVGSGISDLGQKYYTFAIRKGETAHFKLDSTYNSDTDLGEWTYKIEMIQPIPVGLDEKFTPDENDKVFSFTPTDTDYYIVNGAYIYDMTDASVEIVHDMLESLKTYVIIAYSLEESAVERMPRSGACGIDENKPDEVSDNVTWSLDDNGVLTIRGTGAMSDNANTMSYRIQDYVHAVVIENGVTSVGAGAFSDFSYLTEVTIPNSVTSIGGGAFSDCSSLTSVTIPNTVTNIGFQAFFCCSSLTSITIPSSVTSIDNYAFQGCSSLTSVSIPNSVTSIGYGLFQDCSSLTSVTIPSSVTSISESAFSGCSSLKEINVAIDNTEFSSLGGVLFSKDKSELILCPQRKTGSYTIPNSVTSVSDSAFFYCSSLTSITIPKSVTSIGHDSFCGCSSLTNITIPNSVTSIGDWAFYNCSSLKDVYYGGTKEQWDKISISDGNYALFDATIHFTYTISFNPNGGSVSTNKKDVITGETYGELPTPTRSGYSFSGWYTQANDGSLITSSTTVDLTADQTLYAHWERNETGFVWGTDNWNFNNSSYEGYFSSGRYIDQIDSDYLNKLKSNLDNVEYRYVFATDDGLLYQPWWGSCYGMSALTLLAKNGLFPYSQYKSGATSLNQLSCPTQDRKISSLITYYQMLQVKDVIQNQYRTVPSKSNEQNIKKILSELENHETVLVGFQKAGWGGHAIIATGVDYGSYTWNDVTYQGCIRICDPNASRAYNDRFNIYFNTRSYNWTIPGYPNMTSVNGARFNYIGSNVNEINKGGYLSGTMGTADNNFVARIDAYEISNNRSIVKVYQFNGSYQNKAGSNDDIVEDDSYVLGGEREGTVGYNLMDANSSYKVSQTAPQKLSLRMDYGVCSLEAESAAGNYAIFDKSGLVQIDSDSAKYRLAMTFNEDYPTKWFTVQTAGSGADSVSLQKTENGYLMESETLKNVTVNVNNRDESAAGTFSTTEKKALICEDAAGKLDVKIDKNKDGVYETSVLNASAPADPTPASPQPTTKPADTKPSPQPDDTKPSPKPSDTKPADTKPALKNPFTDVKNGDYFFDPVLWALNHDPQITDGMTETTFAPGETCTRGQVVTFLWRAMGCAEPKSTNNPFTDVNSGDYFYKAVLWAVEKGITDGTSATTFSPNDPCTRAHVVTFLWRAENKPAAGSNNPFADVASGQYYYDAVLWAVSKKITDGTSDTTFSPADPCTRGQIVTFLYRDMK